MIGTVKIVVQTPRYVFNLSFERNISIVRGFSGTGKSLLCDLLQRAADGEEGITVSLSNAERYIVMPAVTEGSSTVQNWQTIINNANNAIIFIDEMCDCLNSGVFAKLIQNTNNYYIIISRKSHSDLPYSIESIYYFDSKSDTFSRKQITAEKLYPNGNSSYSPDIIVTEDSGAGYTLYNRMYLIAIDSAKSKTRITKKARTLISQGRNNILFIVDGAAFGDVFDTLIRYLNAAQISYAIYAPESFEWVLLHSSVFKDCQEIDSVLHNYLEIIDWSKFFSAERYFTHVLKEYSRLLGLVPYDKSINGLDECLLTSSSLESIRAIIPIVQAQKSDQTEYFK